MLRSRRGNSAWTSPRLLVSAFISAMVLLHVTTIWRDDAARRKGQQSEQFKTDNQRHELGGVEDLWRQQQERLEKQQKEAIAKSSKDAAQADQTPEARAIEANSTATSTSSRFTTLNISSAPAALAATSTTSTLKAGRVQEVCVPGRCSGAVLWLDWH